jgi:hypothetical protein
MARRDALKSGKGHFCSRHCSARGCRPRPGEHVDKSVTRVWIAQCLCPQRHCILAASGEADSEPLAEEAVAAPLRKAVGELLQSAAVNPWCGLCRAPAESWIYELRRTRFQTMAEAAPELKRLEREMAVARQLMGDSLHRQRPN